jgi:hypothetical protein
MPSELIPFMDKVFSNGLVVVAQSRARKGHVT